MLSHQKDSENDRHERHPEVQATFVNDVRSLSEVVEEIGRLYLEKYGCRHQIYHERHCLGNREEC